MRSIAAAGSIAAVLAAAAGCAGKGETGDSASVSMAAGDTSHLGAMSSGDTVPTAGIPSTSDSGSKSPSPAPGGGKTGGKTPAGPSSSTSIRPAPGADTLRGIVRVVGAGIDAGPALRPNGGGAQVALLGPHAATLSRLTGTDVWVSGTRSRARGFNVDRFLVRSVGGVAAMDGTLTARDGGVAIVTTGEHAEHPIANPPAALRSHIGARVWITGPLETGAVAFGVISDR